MLTLTCLLNAVSIVIVICLNRLTAVAACLQVDYLPSEAPGKPQDREMNPGFGDKSAES